MVDWNNWKVSWLAKHVILVGSPRGGIYRRGEEFSNNEEDVGYE